MSSSQKTTTMVAPTPGSDDSSWMLSYDFKDYCETTVYGTLAVFDMAITILGMLSSLLLLVIICKNPRLRGDKYLLLNHLLGSSFCLLCLSGFLYVEDAINPCWSAGPFVCKIVYFLKTCLTNTSTIFLIMICIEQLNRYRQKFVTVLNSTHARCYIVIGIVWITAVLVSIPEFTFANILNYSDDFSLCQIHVPLIRKKYFITAKLLFVEYIAPLLVLTVVVVTTGIYVNANKSRYSSWGTTTTGANIVPRDHANPRHFTLVAVLTASFVVGYFPMYSFELATMLLHVTDADHYSKFWWHMESISTFFLLLPPALTPMLVMLLSWEHSRIIKSIYEHFTFTEFVDEEQESPPYDKIRDEHTPNTQDHDQGIA